MLLCNTVQECSVCPEAYFPFVKQLHHTVLFWTKFNIYGLQSD